MKYPEEDYKAMAAAAGNGAEWNDETKCMTVPTVEGSWLVENTWQPDIDPADNYRLVVDAGITISKNYAEVGEGLSLYRVNFDEAISPKINSVMKAVCDCAIAQGSQNA